MGEVEGWKGVAGWGRCGLVWADEESGELSMDIKAFLYLAALVVFAFGCRTFESRWIQKAGWVALLVASYLLGFWLTGSHAAGAMGVRAASRGKSLAAAARARAAVARAAAGAAPRAEIVVLCKVQSRASSADSRSRRKRVPIDYCRIVR